jgi:hypothetical protein
VLLISTITTRDGKASVHSTLISGILSDRNAPKLLGSAVENLVGDLSKYELIGTRDCRKFYRGAYEARGELNGPRRQRHIGDSLHKASDGEYVRRTRMD